MRFIILLILQGVIFKAMSLQLGYFHIFIYPLFVILLPLNFSITGSLLLAFFMGIMVDLFYATPGLNSATLLVTAFIRPLFIQIMEIKEVPSNRRGIFPGGIEFPVFLRLSIWLTTIHLLIFYLLEAKGWNNLGDTMLKIVGSSFVSVIMMIMYVLIMRPKNT
jgi:hypothetical protein